jgi:dinuclear metal center YbgI/SA1388 family protein
MLLTHHPLIFSPQNRITAEDFTGKRIIKLIANDICCYASHTNFDVLGMGVEAAERLALEERSVLEITFEDELSQEGIGRVGILPECMTLRECASYVKETFDLDTVKVFGEEDRKVRKAAVVPGAGKDYIRQAVRAGADVYITGDIGHHDGIDALEQGLTIIDAGHFGVEQIFVPYMKEFLSRELPSLHLLSARQQEPFWYE